METVSSSDLRANLAEAMQRVCDDHAPIVVTRKRGRPVVLLSLDDYSSLKETAYLTRSPANAKRLSEAIESLESGRGKRRTLAP